jgi:hypothetical protein
MRTFDKSDKTSIPANFRQRYYKFDQTVKCRNLDARRQKKRRRTRGKDRPTRAKMGSKRMPADRA